MTQKQLNRMKLSAVCSLQAYEWLQKWIIERHPGNPYPGEPKTYFYRNTTHRQYLSKFLESVIIKVLRYKGCSPIKANDAGTYRDTSKTVMDVLGNERKIGSGTWSKAANVARGRSDIVVFYNGDLINYEVKVKFDRMSPDQITEKKRAELNGEKYIVIKTVQDFIDTIE